MRDFKIKNFDTCYTFMLRWFNCLKEYIDVESCDFGKLFNKKRIYNITELENNDVLLYESNNANFGNKELLNGIPLCTKMTTGLHYAIFYNNLIYDLHYLNGTNNIRVRLASEFNLEEESLRIIKGSCINNLVIWNDKSVSSENTI